MTKILLIILFSLLFIIFNTTVSASNNSIKWVECGFGGEVEVSNGGTDNNEQDDEDNVKIKPIEHPVLEYLTLMFALLIAIWSIILRRKKIEKRLVF